VPITIISFGYLHGQPPAADITQDMRPFRDPHVDPAMRQLTGTDPAVIAKVLDTPGVRDVIDQLTQAATQAARGSSLVYAVGCAGGRHRSVVVANTLAYALAAQGFRVTVKHRDVHRPVVNR
jgi:UPF0042 nucleotide-binding protein